MEIDRLREIIKHTKKLNVLYVEDNLEVQQQTTKMLESFFKNICVAPNGKVALELFITNDFYHLIITDIKMPIVDGLSLIESIRNLNKKVPIIVLSAHDDKNYFLKTIKSGIDGYILKPYTLKQIADTLVNIIEKYDFEKIFTYIVKLENDFYWDTKAKQLYKNSETIKLSKNEKKLFDFFISTNSFIKTYEDMEEYIFGSSDNNFKNIRNLTTRLRIKLGYELFDTIYSQGYSIKYKQLI